VIPAYNVEGYIRRAIDSILAQTRLPDEIIVVDDGSRDATAEKIKSYGDKVRYIYQNNRGLSGARNTGIREAAYDWIAFLDADDEWLPKHLELQTALLESNPDLRWVSGNFICCLCDEDRKGAAGEPETIRRLLEDKDYFSSYFKAHANGVAGHPDTMLIHKEIFDKIGFFNEQQAFAEDIEMWWRIAFSYPSVGYVAEPIAVYHLQRPGTLTEEFQKRKFHWLIRLLEDNLEVAVVKNRLDEFKPVVRFLVTSWIRGLLFENNPDQVKELIGKFGMFLSIRFRLMVHLLLIYPEGTAWMCHRLSKIVRKYKLRKKITRQPSR
jgi:glycosyltransferase involved in cell wall biosynthesis